MFKVSGRGYLALRSEVGPITRTLCDGVAVHLVYRPDRFGEFTPGLIARFRMDTTTPGCGAWTIFLDKGGLWAPLFLTDEARPFPHFFLEGLKMACCHLNLEHPIIRCEAVAVSECVGNIQQRTYVRVYLLDLNFEPDACGLAGFVARCLSRAAKVEDAGLARIVSPREA